MPRKLLKAAVISLKAFWNLIPFKLSELPMKNLQPASAFDAHLKNFPLSLKWNGSEFSRILDLHFQEKGSRQSQNVRNWQHYQMFTSSEQVISCIFKLWVMFGWRYPCFRNLQVTRCDDCLRIHLYMTLIPLDQDHPLIGLAPLKCSAILATFYFLTL